MKTMIFLLSLMLMVSVIMAESFDERLQQLGEDAGKDYVRPLVTAFGTNLNSGLFNTADVLSPSIIRPVRVGVGVQTMLAFVPDSDKTFDFEWDHGIDGIDPVTGETATVFGDKGYSDEDIEFVRFPDGLDVGSVPLIVPHLRVGLPKGNELMIRGMPPMSMGDYGDLSFWGVGLKHSIDQYIPLFPVDLALQAAYQSFKVGELVDISSLALNAQVSRRLLMLTAYGGLGWESTTLEADYVHHFEGPDGEIEQDISFDISGDNELRMTAGIRWAFLPFLHVSADYTISNYQVVSLGLGGQF